MRSGFGGKWSIQYAGLEFPLEHSIWTAGRTDWMQASEFRRKILTDGVDVGSQVIQGPSHQGLMGDDEDLDVTENSKYAVQAEETERQPRTVNRFFLF